MEVLANVSKNFYIEKRRTLGLYHIVHKSSCDLVPYSAKHIKINEITDTKDIVTKISDKFGRVEKCQVCFKN
ncbi:hypothetical protein [Zunongwangia sp.]|uniref:hypothetical protein n=1 Tax=Zunongwangia sp. TaxID=1965325 RepID=UPI003AA88693